MNDEQKASYLKETHKCPFCKSEAIRGEDHDFDGETIWKNIVCESCEKEWRDIFRLVDVEEVEEVK